MTKDTELGVIIEDQYSIMSVQGRKRLSPANGAVSVEGREKIS